MSPSSVCPTSGWAKSPPQSSSVKRAGSLTEDEVHRFCLELPRYKRPKRIIFAPVPRNATGKIEKPKLREIYCVEHLVAAQNGIVME